MKTDGHIRLKDIAELANVSSMTVSKVLNDRTGNISISEETKKRVRDAARELGYKTNLFAKALRTGSPRNIAMLLSPNPDESNIWPRMIGSMLDALSEKNYLLTLNKIPAVKSADTGFMPRIINEITADGIFINYNINLPPELAEAVENHGTPAVYINIDRDKDCIRSDDKKAASDATERFIKMGHRRIAYADFTVSGHYSIREYREGYSETMTKNGLAPLFVNERGHIPRPERVELSKSALKKLGFTAALTISRTTALPLIYAALETGVKIPRDLSVATFDAGVLDYPFPVDSWSLPWDRIGREAVMMMLKKLQHPAAHLEAEKLAFELKEGVSSAPPRDERRAQK